MRTVMRPSFSAWATLSQESSPSKRCAGFPRKRFTRPKGWNASSTASPCGVGSAHMQASGQSLPVPSKPLWGVSTGRKSDPTTEKAHTPSASVQPTSHEVNSLQALSPKSRNTQIELSISDRTPEQGRFLLRSNHAKQDSCSRTIAWSGRVHAPVLTVAVSEKAARTNSRRTGSAISSAIAIWLAPRSTASGVSKIVPCEHARCTVPNQVPGLLSALLRTMQHGLGTGLLCGYYLTPEERYV